MESRKPVVDVSCARLFRMGRVQREVGGLAARPEGGSKSRVACFVGGPLVNRPSEGDCRRSGREGWSMQLLY